MLGTFNIVLNTRWNMSLKPFSDKNPSQELFIYLMRVHPELHVLGTTDSNSTSGINRAIGVLPLWKCLITFFYHLDLFCRQYFILVKFKYILPTNLFTAWKLSVSVTVKLLWCGLNIVMIFEKQTQLQYIVLPKRHVMHLWLHKLKGTLSEAQQ